jgi:hypothetical protein
LFKEVLEWFERHGDIKRIRELNEQDNLPLRTMIRAKTYLDELN